MEQLSDAELMRIVRSGRTIQMALVGDPVALRLCLDRIYPARRDRPVTFALPPINCARDAADISAAVAAAVSNGDITLGEATEVAKLIDTYVKAYKAAELDDRTAPIRQLTDAELNRIAYARRSEGSELLRQSGATILYDRILPTSRQ
jgi:hypothetical protein